jgi:hypothetical protein
MAVPLSPFNRAHRDPVQKRHVSAATVAIGLHIFVAYVTFTIKITRPVLERAEEVELTWITLAVPVQRPPEIQPAPKAPPDAATDRDITLPPVPTLPSSTAITQPTTPGLEVLSVYVGCGLPDTNVQTLENRENCEHMRAALGDGKPETFVQTPEERVLWAKFAQDKAVQEAGVFSVCSNRGGATIALTIRLIGGEWLIGDASNAQRKADTNMLDDSALPGGPQFGCDTPEGKLFKPWLK